MKKDYKIFNDIKIDLDEYEEIEFSKSENDEIKSIMKNKIKYKKTPYKKIVASLLIAEMAAYYYDKGLSLYEGLQALYEKYGYFKEKTISLTLKGIEGLAKIKEIITYFRENDINEFNSTKVVDLKDYQKGIDGLPKSNVLKYFLEDGSWIAVRPSGTEPKLKFYVAVKGEDEAKCSEKIANIESDINKIIEQVK